MQTVDATCLRCGKAMRWTSGTARVCLDCRLGTAKPESCPICGDAQDGHTHLATKQA